MRNIITASELSHIIEEAYNFYDSYPLETRITLTKLHFRLNHGSGTLTNITINIEETARTLNPLIITL